MRAAVLLVLCLLFPMPSWGWSGEVVSVHDGDTLKVRRADTGKIITVRVYGVDCPELGQPWGKEARDMTAQIALGKTVEVIPAQTRKSYKREVAGLVRLDALVILQDVLVSTGLAWVDDRYCKLEVCDFWRLHQTDAKAATPPRGLWADENSTPPWQWRKMKRQRK